MTTIMGKKLIVNQTGYDLEVGLGARLGSTPDEGEGGFFSAHITPNNSEYIIYGDDSNPFMDALQVSLNGNIGGLMLLQQTVMEKGGALDNLFNTNDTLTITLNGMGLSVSGSNTWT